jgi:NACalpha-BTF3-like transcription factor
VPCAPIRRERAAKLAKVKLNPEDVDFYVNNCCCPKDQAEKALRETEGDLKAALLAFAQG